MKANFQKALDIGAPQPINALTYITDPSLKRWVLMWLGTGELGPADGSQIMDLDNYGYQKYPSFEPEFNIFVPQAVRGYIESDAYVQQYLVKTYGEDIEIFTCGHSLGARNVMELSYGYNGIKAVPQVVGFMPVAGEMSWPLPTDWCTAVDKPIIAFAGDKDTAIWCGQSQKYVDAINSCPTRKHKAVCRIIPGKGHTDIMDYVFAPDRNAEGYKFIMSCFSPQQKENTGTVCYLDGKVVVKFIDGTTKELLTNG